MRILLAEDDPKMARVLAIGLRDAGHAVDTVGDGDRAFESAVSGPYDLLILDVMLPGRDGITTCRDLRATGSRLPVLMLTARDSLQDRVGGLDAGADDYLTKPFAFEELLARLRSLGRRGGPTRRPTIRHGRVRLDPAKRIVEVDGSSVVLTAREFALLEVLLDRPGELVTRTQLIERVWDDRYDGLSNLVDVYIARLRRKLGSAERPWPLRTVRGAGYVLDSDD
ncbi:MAG: response regulator transcription factor [Thermoleophilia bacterium]